MRLRAKINLIVGALTLLFVAALLALQIQGMRDAVHEEVVAANRVAAQLLNRAVWGYGPRGTVAVQNFLQGLGRVRSTEISLFNDRGDLLYRSPPSAYKVGRDAPGWFARLLAPVPSVKAISFTDGRLEVRANASRAVLDAWDNFTQTALASAALLVLVNLMVLWLVGHAVRPFGQIVGALNQLEAGRFDVALPRLPSSEAAAIGAAFNRMVARLQQHLETETRALRAERELSDSRELARWIDHHIEQERRAIARELHDELGQSVTAIRSMALSIAQRMAPLDAPSEQTARLIAEESSRLYAAMHGLIPRLAPMVLDTLGLEAALKDLVARTQRSHPVVQIELQLDLVDAVLSADAALALYRAAQEGITNALRHGQARHLRLRLQAGTDPVTLDLTDDGIGLPAAAAPGAAAMSPGSEHYGLRWLAERAEGLGGKLSVHSAQPHGVQLRMSLPAQPAAPATPATPVAPVTPVTPAAPAAPATPVALVVLAATEGKT